MAGASNSTSAPSLGEILQYTFFNKAATPNPVQSPGQSTTGVITGSVHGGGLPGAVITYTTSQDPSQGSVAVNPDGTYAYTPNAQLAHNGGTDSFTVTIDNGSAYRMTGLAGTIQGLLHSVAQLFGLSGPDTAQAVVEVTVAAINHPPTATVNVQSPNSSGQVYGKVVGKDADGDTLTYKVSKAPSKGTVDLRANGTFTFTPTAAARKKAAAANATAGDKQDTFKVTVSDGHGGTTTVAVKVSIKPASQPTLSQKVATFVANTRGKTIAAPDGSYPGECVSLVKRYLQDVFGITAGAWGNAINYAPGYASSSQAGKLLSQPQHGGFTWHPASSGTNFQNGDILVFGASSAAQTGSAGHIGIWHNGQLYDQNDGWRANARTANYSPYSRLAPALLGYWSPPSGTTQPPQYAIGTVMARTQRMKAATLTSQQLGWYAVGTKLSLVCYARGQSVKGYYSYAISGGWDNLWYKTSDGGFAADVDLNTGSNNPVTGGC